MLRAILSTGNALLLAYMLLAIAIIRTRGWYEPLSLLLVLATFVLVVSSLLISVRTNAFSRPVQPALALLAVAVMCVVSWTHEPLKYAIDPGMFQARWHGVLILSAIIMFFLYIVRWPRQPRARSALFWCMVALGIGCRIHAVIASPKPIIDVFDMHQHFASTLLSFINPYNSFASFTDTHTENIMQITGYIYPPSNLLLFAPFFAIFRDVRYAYVAADLITVVLLRILARRHSSSATSDLAAILYLLYVGSLFTIEQAWTEPLMFPFVLLALLAMESRWHGVLSVAFGFLFTMKQYLLFVPLHALAATRSWRTVGTACIVAMCIVLPFLLWDPAAFYESTILQTIQFPRRMDAMSLVPYTVYTFGIELPSRLSFAMGGFSALLLAVVIRPLRPSVGFLYATCITLFVLFLTGNAFFNYYYLLAFLILCLIAVQGDGPKNAQTNCVEVKPKAP